MFGDLKDDEERKDLNNIIIMMGKAYIFKATKKTSKHWTFEIFSKDIKKNQEHNFIFECWWDTSNQLKTWVKKREIEISVFTMCKSFR